MSHRVATVQDEARCLPDYVRLNSIGGARLLGLEPIWMVNEETGKIDAGTMIDTYQDRSFDFLVYEGEAGFDLLPTTDWKPLPQDD